MEKCDGHSLEFETVDFPRRHHAAAGMFINFKKFDDNFSGGFEIIKIRNLNMQIMLKINGNISDF
jgi:hypothetical protein